MPNEQSLERRMEALFDRLWPLNRSITGEGVRRTLDILADVIPTERLRFQTGRKVFDWTVPKEWHVNDAYFIGPDEQKRACFKRHNLHLMGYSTPFKGRMSLAALRPHLYSDPAFPDAIPYLTSYYKQRWGFCLSQRELETLPDGEYDVVVDTRLFDGFLDIGEAVLEGTSEEEFLFSSYICHPSLANNELSGPIVTAFLYETLRQRPNRRFRFRFALTAETIGTLCYLSERGEHLKQKMKAGLLISGVGLDKPPIYRFSRRANTPIDRAAALVLRDYGPHRLLDFDPGNGSDERQYCSPGFDLPLGSVLSAGFGDYPEYHTSLDNKNCIRFGRMKTVAELILQIVDALEMNVRWKNTNPFGEPQLGRRGLYPTLGGKVLAEDARAICWLLNFSDGENDLLRIAERSKIPVARLIPNSLRLFRAGLLEPLDAPRDFVEKAAQRFLEASND
jgi:aminopeptidase-like protein